MIENIRKTLKQLQKTIKKHNYKIIYTTGELKYIEHDEVLFYNNKDLDVVFIAKRIKNNNSIDIFYYNLNKPNNQQLINFLDKQIYECLICYETNNINNEDNEDLKFKRCPECFILYCETCFKKFKKCAVCQLCFCCFNKNMCSNYEENEQNNTLFYVIH